MFQTFNLLARATSLHNVELPLIYNGTPAAKRIERAKEALTSVGLESAHASQAQRALRRPAPARRDCPRPGQPSFDHPGRRAHRQPRLEDRHRDHGPLRHTCTPRATLSCWSPTSRTSPTTPTAWCTSGTARSSLTNRPNGFANSRARARRGFHMGRLVPPWLQEQKPRDDGALEFLAGG